ncbi:hypothetical protein, partial [Thermus scotoductus]|uniref:hypothetical protein n=1 Tax=Thermus scotoductus TaxID=37636 RepID=UPI001003596F
MEVQILAEAQVLHPPRWALVDYGPLPNGGSLLAVWRYDREGRPVSLHAPNRAWVERVLRELLPGERGVEWTPPPASLGGATKEQTLQDHVEAQWRRLYQQSPQTKYAAGV